MTPASIESESKATSFVFDSVDWPDEGYRCRVCLIPEEDGTWSAVVLNLPGAGSCGDSEEEAMRNVREAVTEVIASYFEDGREIPWSDAAASDVPVGSKQLWILVNA